MQKLKILNTKEVKELQKILDSQFGTALAGDYAFLMNRNNRIFIINKEVSQIDMEKLRINSMGLYIGEKMIDGMRLSIEGSQLIGPKAKENIVELNQKETLEWLKGNDIEKQTDENGFIILKHNNDFIGCGKTKENKILNFVPKTRRLNLSGDLP